MARERGHRRLPVLLWIPACAGITGVLAGMTVRPQLFAPGIPCVRFAPRSLALREGEDSVWGCSRDVL